MKEFLTKGSSPKGLLKILLKKKRVNIIQEGNCEMKEWHTNEMLHSE